IQLEDEHLADKQDSHPLVTARNVRYAGGMNDNNPVTFFAETTFRNRFQRFGIYRDDRRYHMAMIGKTGMGKSTLLDALMSSDTFGGEGFALIDPHGDLAERMFAFASDRRPNDVVYFSPADEAHRLALNVLEAHGADPHLVVSAVISVFKKIWAPD